MRGVVHAVIIMIPVLCTVIAFLVLPPADAGGFAAYCIVGALGVVCAIAFILPKPARDGDLDMRSVLSVLPAPEADDWEDEH